MFEYRQRAATEEYRENWERIFGGAAGGGKSEMLRKRVETLTANGPVMVLRQGEEPMVLRQKTIEDQRAHQANGAPARVS
jgi:hypothetical protein